MTGTASLSEVPAGNARDLSSTTASRVPAAARLQLDRLKAFGAQPAVAKSLPVLLAIGAVGLLAMLWMVFSQPPARELFAGLPDADRGAVVEALGVAGIPYEIDRTTGGVSVADGEYHRARMLLASQGIPKGAPDGHEMIAELPLGSSRAVEAELLRSARESDLARSIEAIDAINSARVHLAFDTPSAFVRDRNKRAASVILRLTPGRVLGAEQVQAIVHLVASSVPALAPEDVSVVDQTGKLLSSGGGDSIAAASERHVAVQSKIENRYRETLTALLTPIVGADNFTAEVHADIDFSEVQATRETFPKDSSALRTEEGSWTSMPGDDAAAGIPGTLANRAPAASEVLAAPDGALGPEGAAAAAAAAAKTSENFTRSFATGREVSVSRQAPGQVRRLTVAVALRKVDGKLRSAQELAELDALVKGAIGFNEARGDMVALNVRTFAPVIQVESKWWEGSWVSPLARNLSALAIISVLVFGIGRPLLRRRLQPQQVLAAGGELLSTTSGSQAVLSAGHEAANDTLPGAVAPYIMPELEPDPADITLKMIETAPSYEARAVLIRNFVRQDPDRAALVLRELLRDEARSDKNG